MAACAWLMEEAGIDAIPLDLTLGLVCLCYEAIEFEEDFPNIEAA